MECSLFYKVKVKHKTLHICILCLHLPTAGTAGLYRSTGSSCPALWPLLLLLLNFFLCCVLPIVKSYWCWRAPGSDLGCSYLSLASWPPFLPNNDCFWLCSQEILLVPAPQQAACWNPALLPIPRAPPSCNPHLSATVLPCPTRKEGKENRR